MFGHFPEQVGGCGTTIVSHRAMPKVLQEGRAAQLLELPLVTDDAGKDRRLLHLTRAEVHLALPY